jgi:hypothetical protein
MAFTNGFLKSIISRFASQNLDTVDCNECKACEIVTPGSVTPHDFHVLVRLNTPAATSADRPAHRWWPEKVDHHPAIQAVTKAILESKEALKGRHVKVTAFEYPASSNVPPPAPDTFDILIFPAAISMAGVPLEKLGDIVVKSLTTLRTSDQKFVENETKINGLAFLVCCHTARDARCGYLGPLLADKLGEMGEQVYISSHVGGHQYAGNVIVYGTKQPSAGTWFGGLSAAEVPEFLTALKALPLSGDPAADKVLRKWWRGRVGLTKEEQIKHFSRCTRRLAADIEDLQA